MQVLESWSTSDSQFSNKISHKGLEQLFDGPHTVFYSLGGYFVIEDLIILGALIAVLAAHKDFSVPLKELFRYYQYIGRYSDRVSINYYVLF